MAVQEVGLYLEFVGVGPEVVGLADGYVGAARSLVGTYKVARQSHIGLALKQDDALRVARLPLAAALGGAVGTAVVADDELVVEEGVLQHYAAYGLVDIGPLVVSQHQHAYLDRIVHGSICV